jgi:hypothetical protein
LESTEGGALLTVGGPTLLHAADLPFAVAVELPASFTKFRKQAGENCIFMYFCLLKFAGRRKSPGDGGDIANMPH